MKKAILTLSLFFVVLSAMSQGNKHHPRFDPAEFRAKLEAYITQKAGLTNAEAAKFFPIYHEMKGKQRELSKKILDLKRKHPASNAPEKQYSDVINKIAELDVEAAKIKATYYKKLCKAVPPQKVYNAILADDSFHREMVQRFNGRGKKQH